AFLLSSPIPYPPPDCKVYWVSRFPPSTGSRTPLMYSEAGDRRKTIAAATSAGRPTRPMGLRAMTADPSGDSSRALVRGVSTMPGATALARMPRGRVSARCRVYPAIPAFAAGYHAVGPTPRIAPATEATLTTVPLADASVESHASVTRC